MVNEKKERRLTVRFSEKDFEYLEAVSYMAGMTVSQYVRAMAQTAIAAVKVQEQNGVIKLEDIKAIRNNKL